MNRKIEIISDIMKVEWPMFIALKRQGGGVSIQEDPGTYEIIRTSNFVIWSEAALESYLGDLKRARDAGKNLIAEKYAHIEAILQDNTLPLDDDIKDLVDIIIEQEFQWVEAFVEKYPDVKLARPIYSSQDTATVVSSETYSRGELATYSKNTLECYYRDNLDMQSKDLNRIEIAIGIMSKRFAERTVPESDAKKNPDPSLY